MRSKIIFLAVAALFLSWNLAQAQNFTKQERKVQSFDAIQINGSADVFLTQGSHQSVVVETEARNQDKIITEVSGSTLIIKSKPYSNFITKRLRVYVETPNIQNLAVFGSGDFHVPSITSEHLTLIIKGSGDIDAGNLQVSTLTAKILGSGDLTFSGKAADMQLSVHGSGDTRINALECDKADFQVQGSGDVIISGKANQVTVVLQGSGDFRGSQFEVSKATTSQLGSGDIHMGVINTLMLTIKGSGDFYLKGNPTVNSEIRGSGELHR